jgi:hypothetical protein
MDEELDPNWACTQIVHGIMCGIVHVKMAPYTVSPYDIKCHYFAINAPPLHFPFVPCTSRCSFPSVSR